MPLTPEERRGLRLSVIHKTLGKFATVKDFGNISKKKVDGLKKKRI